MVVGDLLKRAVRMGRLESELGLERWGEWNRTWRRYDDVFRFIFVLQMSSNSTTGKLLEQVILGNNVRKRVVCEEEIGVEVSYDSEQEVMIVWMIPRQLLIMGYRSCYSKRVPRPNGP